MEFVNTMYSDKMAKTIIKNAILDFLKGKHKNNIVVLCIGSSTYGGDSMAPFVGTFLDKSIKFPIFGTLKNPVHMLNLNETLEKIEEKYKQPSIIVVCGSINSKREIGSINIIDGSIAPGAGVGAGANPIGDISITGVVNIGKDAIKAIERANMYIVFELARAIANGIIDALYEL